jgi:hypothetical protein
MRNKQGSKGSKITILWAMVFGFGFYSTIAGLLLKNQGLCLSGLVTLISSSAMMLLVSGRND